MSADATAAVTASIPYALVALGDHITSHALPIPQSVDMDHRGVTVWLNAEATEAWMSTAIEVHEVTRTQRPHPDEDWFAHTATAVLHHSCLRVTLRWLTHTSHADALHTPCAGSDTHSPGHVTLCLHGPHDGAVELACTHGLDLCDECRPACPECRDDARQDADAGWTR